MSCGTGYYCIGGGTAAVGWLGAGGAGECRRGMHRDPGDGGVSFLSGHEGGRGLRCRDRPFCAS